MQTHSQRAALLHHLFHKLTTTPKSFRSSPILKFPPWLEISQQIKYKNLICQLQRFSRHTNLKHLISLYPHHPLHLMFISCHTSSSHNDLFVILNYKQLRCQVSHQLGINLLTEFVSYLITISLTSWLTGNHILPQTSLLSL